MKKVTVTICPICGSTELSTVFSCTDFYASKEEFNIGKCKTCGFLFTQQFPAENEIGRYYDTKDYISHSNTKKGLVNKLYHLVRSFMLAKKANIIKKNAPASNRTILDIGCGTGFFLNQMQKCGWQVSGVEKNTEAREFTHRNFGIMTYAPGKLEEYAPKSFGVISLWHVLEHLEDLKESMQRINGLLTDDGTLVIAVPNAASADASFYKNMWAAFDVPRHLWHFTPNTMKLLAKNNGFKIVKLYPMPFDAFYVSMLSEKYKQSKVPFLKGLGIGLICWLQSINKKSKSSSIIYILKKV